MYLYCVKQSGLRDIQLRFLQRLLELSMIFCILKFIYVVAMVTELDLTLSLLVEASLADAFNKDCAVAERELMLDP